MKGYVFTDPAIMLGIILAVCTSGWIIFAYAVARRKLLAAQFGASARTVIVSLSLAGAFICTAIYLVELPEEDSRHRFSYYDFICAAPWAFVGPALAYVAVRLSRGRTKYLAMAVFALTLYLLVEVVFGLLWDNMAPVRNNRVPMAWQTFEQVYKFLGRLLDRVST